MFTTTAPTDGPLVPGRIYTDTFLDAGQRQHPHVQLRPGRLHRTTPIAVDATWTGTGAVTKVSSRFNSKDGQTAFSFSFKCTQRQATVTGSIDDLDLSTATFASLSNGTPTDTFTCHAC